MTDLVLVPAACYPVYPAIAARGVLPPGGVFIDAGGSYRASRDAPEDAAVQHVSREFDFEPVFELDHHIHACVRAHPG
jgi:hypothetical protein